MDELRPRVVREWKDEEYRYRLVFTGAAYEVQFAGTARWMAESDDMAVAQLGRQVEELVGEGPAFERPEAGP